MSRSTKRDKEKNIFGKFKSFPSSCLKDSISSPFDLEEHKIKFSDSMNDYFRESSERQQLLKRIAILEKLLVDTMVSNDKE